MTMARGRSNSLPPTPKSIGDRPSIALPAVMSLGRTRPKDASLIESMKGLPPRRRSSAWRISTRLFCKATPNRPIVEFHPSDYVNDPFVIAQNDNMVAVNSAIAVDLTGQVCSDSIGDTIYSGFGGQVDFVRGASRAKNGRAIIALLSTAKDGQLSRITTVLDEGAVS